MAKENKDPKETIHPEETKLIKILKLDNSTGKWNEREVTEEQAESLLKDFPNSFKMIEKKK